MRGDFRRGVPLTIADGYHRICASYHLDENADIPCHLVDHKGPTAVPGFRLGSAVDAGTGPTLAVEPAPRALVPRRGPAQRPGPGPARDSSRVRTPAGAGSGPGAGAGSAGGSEAPGGA